MRYSFCEVPFRWCCYRRPKQCQMFIEDTAAEYRQAGSGAKSCARSFFRRRCVGRCSITIASIFQGNSGHGDRASTEAMLMRYRISRAWPLDHGRLLAPSGTVIDSSSDDEWSRYARGLTPPWDAQALDDEAYQLMLRSYPDHRHLVGPPPPREQTNN